MMTQAKVRFATFEAYLSWSSSLENASEERFELVDGELFALPPEKEINNWIARCLMLRLIASRQVAARLIVTHSLELQVPVLRAGDSANRFPDLVVFWPEHLSMMQNRLTITDEMPPPRMVAEVMSAGKRNRERDLISKRDQYAAREIPEYWLLDPEIKAVRVLQLQGEQYVEVGTFQGDECLQSFVFSDLQVTAAEIFADDQSAVI